MWGVEPYQVIRRIKPPPGIQTGLNPADQLPPHPCPAPVRIPRLLGVDLRGGPLARLGVCGSECSGVFCTASHTLAEGSVRWLSSGLPREATTTPALSLWPGFGWGRVQPPKGSSAPPGVVGVIVLAFRVWRCWDEADLVLDPGVGGVRGRTMMSGLMVRRAPVAAVGVAALIGALTVGAMPASAAPGEQVFTYTGAEQTFTVPVGVTSLTVTAVGGAGGSALPPSEPSNGGAGGLATTVLTNVNAGQTLYVEVGGNGQPGVTAPNGEYGSGGIGGFNGGGKGGNHLCQGTPTCYLGAGGGGASDVRTISRDDADQVASLESRLIVAGGGGGGIESFYPGVGGGAGSDGTVSGPTGFAVGRAGTITAGGAGGGISGNVGQPGEFGLGGAGGDWDTSGIAYANGGGGGGGGGVYGGGGGGVRGPGGGGANSDGSTNTSTAPASVTISWVSVVAPTITGTPGAATVGSPYSFAYTVTGDPAPVVAVIEGALPPGLSLSSEGVLSGTPTQAGTFSFELMADNGVDPDATLESSVTVNPAAPVYTFSGFFNPVDNPPTVNLVNSGRAIPIKFSLGGNFGLNIFTGAGPTFTPTSCTSGVTDPVPVTADSNSGLSYDPVTGVYTYVWKTVKGQGGVCGTFSLNLNDGSTHTVLVGFTK